MISAEELMDMPATIDNVAAKPKLSYQFPRRELIASVGSIVDA
jgi:hypothetical protein